MPSASTSPERPPTLLESALRRESLSAVVLLVMIPVLSWRRVSNVLRLSFDDYEFA
jgi:hypothetical protein